MKRTTLLGYVIALILPLTFSLEAAERAGYQAAFESITSDELKTHVDTLADDTFEGREAGTRGGRAAAGYLVRLFEQYGLQGAGDDGGYLQSFGRGYRNILGVIVGSDPKLKHEVIVISAHYDHVGYGTARNSYGPTGYIHNGADDNASGTSGLIETIQAFTMLPEAPRRTILFALWDGEEKGLLGSKHWTAHPTLPLKDVKLMINCDMIGRLRNDKVEVFGTRTGFDMRPLVSKANRNLDLKLDFTWELKANSDHHSFYARQIPVLMLHTGLHNDYHRPRDDAHKVNVAGMQRVVRLLFNVTWDAAQQDRLSKFRSDARQDSPAAKQRFEQPLAARQPRLGIRWAANQDEQSGLLIASVNRGSAGQRAGLQPSDRILKFDGRDVTTKPQFLADIQVAPKNVVFLVQRRGAEEPTEIPCELDGTPVRVGLSWRQDAANPSLVFLARVIPGSPAYEAGLRFNDRLYELNGQPIDPETLREQISTAPSPLRMVIERDGNLKSIDVQVPPALEAQLSQN